jgi:protein-L-isoaspartate(D-aspartate) O-methyltransferase
MANNKTMKAGIRTTVLFLMMGTLAFRPEIRASSQKDEDAFARRRRAMVVEQLEARDIKDKRVLEAMGRVPRHLFVPLSLRDQAYADHPLPIGEDQTISQPYIVALMSQCLELRGAEKVLEVGTGSGYQAAVLSLLASRVFSVEINASLAESARSLLRDLGCANVDVRTGDGFFGWPEEAPFDGIIVTCAARRVPGPLFDQLKEGGRLVIPVGETGEGQRLLRVRKLKGKAYEEEISLVMFVPMLGQDKKKD